MNSSLSDTEDRFADIELLNNSIFSSSTLPEYSTKIYSKPFSFDKVLIVASVLNFFNLRRLTNANADF